MEITTELLQSIAQGDEHAREALAKYCYPILQRFAHGRLPLRARGPTTTEDIVSPALAKSIAAIDGFEIRHEGAFLAYARRAVLNEIHTLLRKREMKPGVKVGADGIEDTVPSMDLSPVDAAVTSQFRERYDEALERLPGRQREAFVLRCEFGFPYKRVARAVGVSSDDAARMLVDRAVRHLRQELKEFEGDAS